VHSDVAGFVDRIRGDVARIRRHGVFCDAESCDACGAAALGAFVAAMGAWEVFLEKKIADEMQSQDPTTDAAEALVRLRATRWDAESETVVPGGTDRGYILLHEPSMVRAVADHWVEDSSVGRVMAVRHSDVERIVGLRHAAVHGTAHSQTFLLPAARHYLARQDVTSAAELLLGRDPIGRMALMRILDDLASIASEMSPSSDLS
jgi:hypothetical protein